MSDSLQDNSLEAVLASHRPRHPCPNDGHALEAEIDRAVFTCPYCYATFTATFLFEHERRVPDHE